MALPAACLGETPPGLGVLPLPGPHLFQSLVLPLEETQTDGLHQLVLFTIRHLRPGGRVYWEELGLLSGGRNPFRVRRALAGFRLCCGYGSILGRPWPVPAGSIWIMVFEKQVATSDDSRGVPIPAYTEASLP